MKRIIGTLVLLGLLAIGGYAGMDDQTFSVDVVTTLTNTATRTLRGTLEAVKVDITSGKTCTVEIADTITTFFTASNVTADAVYYPRVPLNTKIAGNLTFNTYSIASTINTQANTIVTYGITNAAAGTYFATTNTLTTYSYSPTTTAAAQTWYGKYPMAGAVTVTCIGASPLTNEVDVTIIYDK